MASRGQPALSLCSRVCSDVVAADGPHALCGLDTDVQRPGNTAAERAAAEACALEDEARELRTAGYYRATTAAHMPTAAVKEHQHQVVSAALPVTRFEVCLLRLHLRESLLSKPQQPPSPPVPVASLAVPVEAAAAIGDGATPVSSVTETHTKRGQVGRSHAKASEPPAPPSCGPTSPVNSHEKDRVVGALSQPPSPPPPKEQELEVQHTILKHRAEMNHKELQEFKRQKLTLEHLKLALELGVISRTECMEQGAIVVADLCR
ncbi:hypothetical protein Gpo141_00009399 [Globisporangium polare]